jgi:hypothetical protein
MSILANFIIMKFWTDGGKLKNIHGKYEYGSNDSPLDNDRRMRQFIKRPFWAADPIKTLTLNIRRYL